MRINFRQQILGLDNQPIVYATQGDVQLFLTMLHVCQEALTATFSDEPNLPATKKVERFALAMKIAEQLPVELRIEEVALIKELIGKAYGPLVVGRVFEILEAKPLVQEVKDAREYPQVADRKR